MSKKIMLQAKDDPLAMDFTEQRPNLFKRFGVAAILLSFAACAFISALLMM